jgi:hypothetical protein
VDLSASDHSKEATWQSFVDKSPYILLQRMACKPNEAQQ